jgi:mitochondrial cardiolipin hydrolase
MDMKQLDEIFTRTLEDGKLSRSERQALGQWLEEAKPDERERALARSHAFAAARAAMERIPAHQALEWLEEVVSVLAGGHEAAGSARLAEAYFSPSEACLERIRSLLGGARQSADICVFTITDDRISRPILDAHRRGVKIRVVTDNEKAFDPGSDVESFSRAGIPVAVDTSPAHMHHKFAVFDGKLLLTGSYNWTRGAAAENQENFIVTDEPRFITAFGKEFERLWTAFHG